MRIGLGHLKMSPAAFWRMTLPEFFAACDGYLESKGARKPGAAIGPPTREEVTALFRQLDEEGRLRNG
jgi:uncharacterized phage protein (TIGR02216 family)